MKYVVDRCEGKFNFHDDSIGDRKLNSDDFVIIIVVIMKIFACILHDAFYWFFSCRSRLFSVLSPHLSSHHHYKAQTNSSCSYCLFHMQEIAPRCLRRKQLSFSQRWCINCGVWNLNIYKCNSSSEEEFGWVGREMWRLQRERREINYHPLPSSLHFFSAHPIACNLNKQAHNAADRAR